MSAEATINASSLSESTIRPLKPYQVQKSRQPGGLSLASHRMVRQVPAPSQLTSLITAGTPIFLCFIYEPSQHRSKRGRRKRQIERDEVEYLCVHTCVSVCFLLTWRRKRGSLFISSCLILEHVFRHTQTMLDLAVCNSAFDLPFNNFTIRDKI